MEYLWLGILGVLVLAVASAWSMRRAHTVREFESGVKYVRGRLVAVLPPGRYWRWGSTRIENLDVRPRVLTIPGQEVLTSDNVSIKVSFSLRLRVADAKLAVLGSQNYFETVYQCVQLALRERVAASPLDDLLAKRGELGSSVRAKVEPDAQRLGLAIEVLDVKDLIFAGPLKTVFAQVAVAKQEGLATLERARGESAALRNLANAAHMVQKNPALLQLRWLQALNATSGNKIVVNVGTAPAPAEDGEDTSPATSSPS
jgi:regulator of protease activity HflC (stomatin/prohibitin superfamily)